MSITYNPLWKTLIDKNMNKEDLRRLTNISPSTMAKMSKDEYVALRVIEDICKVLNVRSISEVIEYIATDINIIPESELEMLENTVNVIQNKKDNNENVLYHEMEFLYQLLVSTINSRYKFNKNDYERFYKAYILCLKLLPYELSTMALKTFIANINTSDIQ